MDLYDRIVDEHLLAQNDNARRIKLVDEKSVKQEDEYQQLDLFTDYEAQRKKQAEEKIRTGKAYARSNAGIKKKFGKNAVLKGNLKKVQPKTETSKSAVIRLK